jgi:hypothetical protein
MNPCTRKRVDPQSRSWTPIHLTTRTDYEFAMAEARDEITQLAGSMRALKPYDGLEPGRRVCESLVFTRKLGTRA